jgi:hypothetical protein
MLRIKHWQDAVNAVLGVWLMASPWLLGFQADRTPVSNAFLVGALLLAAALGAILLPRAWEEWAEGILGLWMIASPWLLGFSGHGVAASSAVVTGLVIVGLAVWTLVTDTQYSAWMHKHPAQ